MIRNPFKKEEPKNKKPTFKSAYDESVDTECPRITPPEIILDGGKYAIYVKGAETAKSAGERLLTIFYLLDPKDRKRASSLGVRIPTSPLDKILEGYITLRYGDKAIYIYVGEDKSPESAYRRLGHVMQGLENKALLKNYGITVIERA